MEISKIGLNSVFFRNKNSNSVNEKPVNFSTNPLQCKLLNSPASDVFVKSAESLSFTSDRGPAGHTSEGAVLKKFDGIRGPYSGIPMLSGQTVEAICKKIDKSQTPQEMMNIIRPYADCLLPVQKQVFYMVDGYLAKYPNSSINECLATKSQASIRRLGEKERRILCNISKEAENLECRSDRNKLKRTANEGFRRTREYIYGTDKNGDRVITGSNFRRKHVINAFKDIKSKYCDNNKNFNNEEDEIIFNDLGKLCESLPESKFDLDAFIIKYSQPNKRNNEIAKSLITPSKSTIEHIKTAENGGKNDLRNFMLAADAKNSERDNDTLPYYTHKHPEIKQYCQWYADDIIDLIQDGKMEGYEWYPYALKETLENESNGAITIDVSALNLSDEEVRKGIAQYEIDRERRLTQIGEMH